jgi:hypothetical protein
VSGIGPYSAEAFRGLWSYYNDFGFHGGNSLVPSSIRGREQHPLWSSGGPRLIAAPSPSPPERGRVHRTLRVAEPDHLGRQARSTIRASWSASGVSGSFASSGLSSAALTIASRCA